MIVYQPHKPWDLDAELIQKIGHWEHKYRESPEIFFNNSKFLFY